MGESCTSGTRHDERAAVSDTLDPIVIESMAQDCRANRPGQMRPAFAPIETGAAEHPALGRLAKIDTDLIEERPAGIGQLTAILLEQDKRSLDQPIGDGDGDATGHVVVARSRVPEELSAAPKIALPSWTVLRHDHETFQHAADEWRGQAEIPSPALFFEREEASIIELRKMTARRLRRDTGQIGEFRGGQCPPVHQRCKHVGTRRITDECCDLGNLRSCIHIVFYTGECTARKHKYFGRDRSNSKRLTRSSGIG
jgi:hypothetical protein